MTCKINGPYLPVGDIDWVCRTHGDVVCEFDGGVPSKRTMRCPVADPRPGDSPLEYEPRDPARLR